MRKTYLVLLFSCVLLNCASSDDSNIDLIRKVVKKCVESKSGLWCFVDKTARALENSINWDIPLFDGIQFKRNNFDIEPIQQSRNTKSSFSRLIIALSNFLNTHTLHVDLTDDVQNDQNPRKGGGGGYGGGGGGGHSGDSGGFELGTSTIKTIKKEKKYVMYASMVLLGIFGLTGPLIMNTLAIMAAKALIASKAALIILGSVALKKLFEKDPEKSAVKVHTVHEDDDYGHDRVDSTNKISPYWMYQAHSKQT